MKIIMKMLEASIYKKSENEEKIIIIEEIIDKLKLDASVKKNIINK